MQAMDHRERQRELVPRPDDATLPPDLVVARVLSDALHTVVLVEGASDRVALLTLARKYSRDLAAEPKKKAPGRPRGQV